MHERREEQTKMQLKTLVLPILAIILAVISATGSTLALFTSSEEDGTIGVNVTSGRVNVDIVNTKGDSLVGNVLHLVPKDGRDEEDVYFEPGATFYTEGFRVSNIGTSPVNFRIYVSEDKQLDMTEFEKAFDLRITTDPSSRTVEKPLTDFTGNLAVGQESATYYLVIRMKENAGNEFQDQAYSGIGVTVYAIQGNVELE